MPTWTAFFFGVSLGLCIGYMVERYKWMANSGKPQRVYCCGSLFKVVETKRRSSWEMADMHREDAA